MRSCRDQGRINSRALTLLATGVDDDDHQPPPSHEQISVVPLSVTYNLIPCFSVIQECWVTALNTFQATAGNILLTSRSDWPSNIFSSGYKLSIVACLQRVVCDPCAQSTLRLSPGHILSSDPSRYSGSPRWAVGCTAAQILRDRQTRDCLSSLTSTARRGFPSMHCSPLFDRTVQTSPLPYISSVPSSPKHHSFLASGGIAVVVILVVLPVLLIGSLMICRWRPRQTQVHRDTHFPSPVTVVIPPPTIDPLPPPVMAEDIPEYYEARLQRPLLGRQALWSEIIVCDSLFPSSTD
ncbi:hypothetical protein BDY19DRAFT_301049 [Irpex rosettiformis]|uniref:Uncharacterized protein n=1 Tax=Irpex rosettiformis TaxID=378272 RepID=A0ACB8TYH7_9APHY|nr:hypothetical protein BDY19DRAFT_301049 [Irpex rosettiformis]